MTIDDFWKKYNHCPLCEHYARQGVVCHGCRWEYEHWKDANVTADNFTPTISATVMMNREVDE